MNGHLQHKSARCDQTLSKMKVEFLLLNAIALAWDPCEFMAIREAEGNNCKNVRAKSLFVRTFDYQNYI